MDTRSFTPDVCALFPSASQSCSGAMVTPNCDCHRTTMWRTRSSAPQRSSPPLDMALIAGTAWVFICLSNFSLSPENVVLFCVATWLEIKPDVFYLFCIFSQLSKRGRWREEEAENFWLWSGWASTLHSYWCRFFGMSDHLTEKSQCFS